MYKNILHATDLLANHFDMCQQAVNIAKRFGARLHLLHVIETPISVQVAQGLGFTSIDNPLILQEDAKMVMALMGESLNIPMEQQLVKIGSIKEHVYEMVKELNCDLVIIGHHNGDRLSAYLGNSAQSIIQDTCCDVLTLIK